MRKVYQPIPESELNESTSSSRRELRVLLRRLRVVGNSNLRAACLAVALTLFPYSALLAALILLQPSPLISGALGIFASAFLLRAFSIQHDCGHGGFFPKQSWNRFFGHALSLITLTPYSVWSHNHDLHHRAQGDLDRRGVNDVFLATSDEFRKFSILQRWSYRLYRNRLTLLVISPLLLFIFLYRWPKNSSKFVVETMLHNFAIVAAVILILTDPFVFAPFFLVSIYIGGAVGIFVFYTEHNFEGAQLESSEKRDHVTAAINGSSILDLGAFNPIFDWLTLNIRYHHIHHLVPGIPGYKLRKCYLATRANLPERKISFAEAWRSFSLKLWDEQNATLIPFPR